ncbi:MAG: hypothetical protein ACI9OJ_002005 [Myxococcota bacterium]|jgi:hypothetical protein
MATHKYSAVDCYVIAVNGDTITFVEHPDDEGTPSLEFDLDLTRQQDVDISIWESPRGFTSVGPNGRTYHYVGAAWVTDSWLTSLDPRPTEDAEYKVAYYDESTDRRYMAFKVKVDSFDGNTLKFTYGSTATETVDLTNLSLVDRNTSNSGETVITTSSPVGFEGDVYFSPAFIDGSTLLADPKKPAQTGSRRGRKRFTTYYRVRAIVTERRPSGTMVVVDHVAKVGNPAHEMCLHPEDRPIIDARPSDRPFAGFTTIGPRPNGGFKAIGDMYLTKEFIDRQRNSPSYDSDEHVIAYRRGWRYRAVDVLVNSVTDTTMSFTYSKGPKVGTVDLSDRWFCDRHTLNRGQTTLDHTADPGDIGRLYLSAAWFRRQ